VPPPFCRSIPKQDNQGHQKHTRNISQSRFKTNTALESKKLPCSTDIGVAIKNAWLYTYTPPHVLKVWSSPFGISVDKFALGHIFSGYFLSPLPTTITSMFHTYIPVHIHSPPIRIPTASLLIHSLIYSFSTQSYDRSIAFSKASSALSAIQWLLFKFPVPSRLHKVIR
jgi:hypothetical protein